MEEGKKGGGNRAEGKREIPKLRNSPRRQKAERKWTEKRNEERGRTRDGKGLERTDERAETSVSSQIN
ncbi:hypothetical protein EYF80_035486 [Liparis tanakae]|uniref:Uncharacterized protein n=1 Tax=Liparis tanakae TaxID=230148 RepID=A0A4Z2GLG4_9TELE|nr:hypothetical protein EYF80_035486 [Liparis tanakae]